MQIFPAPLVGRDSFTCGNVCECIVKLGWGGMNRMPLPPPQNSNVNKLPGILTRPTRGRLTEAPTTMGNNKKPPCGGYIIFLRHVREIHYWGGMSQHAAQR